MFIVYFTNYDSPRLVYKLAPKHCVSPSLTNGLVNTVESTRLVQDVILQRKPGLRVS